MTHPKPQTFNEAGLQYKVERLRQINEDLRDTNADLLAALQSSLQFVIAWLPEYESGPQRERIEAQIAKTQAAIARAEGRTDD